MLKTSLFALVAVAAVGCDSSDSITWSKAPADKTQIAVRAAMTVGIGPALSLRSRAEEDSLQAGDCPKRTLSGDTTVLEASGCTSASGRVYKGRVEWTEVSSDASPDSSFDLKATQFEMTTEEGRFVLDGTLHESVTDDALTDANVALRLEQDGTAMHFDADVECASPLNCRTSEASTGSIEGLGEFSIDLQVFEDSFKNFLVLKGTDELRLTGERNPDDCLTYTIDGKTGPDQRICLQ